MSGGGRTALVLAGGAARGAYEVGVVLPILRSSTESSLRSRSSWGAPTRGRGTRSCARCSPTW